MTEQSLFRADAVREPRDLPQAVADVFPDSEAVGRLFTDDANFIVADGTVLTGRSEIAAYFERLLSGADKFGTSLQGVKSIANLDHEWRISPDVAILRTRGGLLMPGESEVAPERQAIQTWVVTRADGTWRAASYQNTRIAQA